MGKQLPHVVFGSQRFATWGEFPGLRPVWVLAFV